MLGLLLLAGLGVAAAALVDHVDPTHDDEEPVAEDPPEASATQGDLLDDPDEGQPDHAALTADDSDPDAAQDADGSDPFPEGQSDDTTSGADDANSAEGGDGQTAVAGPDDPHGAVGSEDGAGSDGAGPDGAGPDGAGSDGAGASPGDASDLDHGRGEDPVDTGHGAALAVARPNAVYGGAGDDTLAGTGGRDLMDGGAGNDLLQGRGGADHLVTFDAGSDTAQGGAGADSLHGYTVNAMPGGDTSFVIEDHAADHLSGGLGADKLWLASGDEGAGGAGADEFHVSWDVDHAHPAEIADYQPGTDRIVIEFTTNHADGNMDPISAADQTVTTQPLHDGSGTAICLNGQPIAHVLGTTTLRAADIAVVHL